jgi:hypothetical protein
MSAFVMVFQYFQIWSGLQHAAITLLRAESALFASAHGRAVAADCYRKIILSEKVSDQ